MTAPNHALTGAVIGLSVANPWAALLLAFLSHFACDAVPHYDPAEQDMARRIGAKSFTRDILIISGGLCALLVLLLAFFRPEHWIAAAIGAFLAASPDLFWLPRYMHVKRTGKDLLPTNWFLRFHNWEQWKTGSKLIWVEAAWFVAFSALVAIQL